MQETITIGQYLLQTLKNLGIQTVYGIPGDFIIKFFKQIEDDSNLKLVTLSHEPAVGFAAIGAARATQKPAVACVTYGPGALNMVNAAACAYSEKVPLIVIAGGPPTNVRASGFLVHHTVKGSDTQLRVYSEVTAKAVVLDDSHTASSLITEALAVCLEQMLPVYIELPADMAEAPIHLPRGTVEPAVLDKKSVGIASAVILSKLSEASKPVFMLGVEAVRYGLVDKMVAVASALNVPVVSTMLARDYMPTKAENYFGVYLGGAGSADAAVLVVQSDFVLMLGEDVSDVNFGMKVADTRSSEIVRCVSSQVKTFDHRYSDTPLGTLVAKLSEAKPKRNWYNAPTEYAQNIPLQANSGLSTDVIIDTLNRFYHEYGEMPTISDTGEFLFATLRLQTSNIIGPAFYGTMGFAVPAAIGYATESKKRPVVLVGDGAFQMTGPEICHCPALGIDPVFIVSNNKSWGMEQLFHPSSINSLVDWRYARLAELWGGKGYVCSTFGELWEALKDARLQRCFCLIEVKTVGTKPPEPLAAYVSEQKR